MSGRKPIYKEPMRRLNLYLPKPLIDKAKKLGNGCISKGVRKALDSARSN